MSFQFEMLLKIQDDLNYYEVSLYNKDQMYLPNPKTFGTEMFRIQLPYGATSAVNGTYQIYEQDFRVTQIHWRALDNKKSRCDDTKSSDDKDVNTSTCIVKYFEKETNCSMALKGSTSYKIREKVVHSLDSKSFVTYMLFTF